MESEAMREMVPRGIEPELGEGAVTEKTEETQAGFRTSVDCRGKEGAPETARKRPVAHAEATADGVSETSCERE